MQKFKKLNTIAGWIVWAIATTVYLLTIEPTVSFWDCGEFIASSYKLEVGHPPGAPFFMLAARFFSLFAPDASHVAMLINAMNALASSFTVLFLFWTITYIARRTVEHYFFTTDQLKYVLIIGAGTIGSLVYAFSDTFWFSAVEGEVYAMSSLLTALVVWLILKWERDNTAYSDRWLLLIAYLIGLSIGVHLLNLLALPAIVLVYYFKKFEYSKLGILLALTVSFLILAIIMWGIIPGVVTVGSWFELLFVNGMKLPFNSGFVFYLILLFGGIIFLVWFFHKKQKRVLCLISVSVLLILFGYSSFALVVIRSYANPPMDENNPEHAFALIKYLNRDQYGDSPLLYGKYYCAPADVADSYTEGKKTYIRKDGRYVVANVEKTQNFDDDFETIFPRMYSSAPQHVKEYMKWGKIEGIPVQYRNGDKSDIIQKPTFIENVRFFVRYQLGHMYWRYFMWNFAGRQNDIQGHGESVNGNWISGISFIDNARLGNQELLSDVYKNNKGRNRYYFLPLLLGILGILYLRNKDNQALWIVGTLFIMTGLAIVIYLNQYPLQPRERDYAYAGSFYAFSVFTGLGMLYLYGLLERIRKSRKNILFALVLCVLVPLLMAQQNWDDHDRSGRYTARDFAANYLNSCAPNAILFTNGDNDTFPLWYAQEVEGIRTDVKVINLSLLATDWYIDQVRRKSYSAAPLPLSFDKEQYVTGTRDIVYIMPDKKTEEYTELADVIDFIKSDDEKTKFFNGDVPVDYVPANRFKITVDKEHIKKMGFVAPEDTSRIVSEIEWVHNKRYMLKNELMVYDMLVQNNWQRPVCFSIAVGRENYFGLEDYFMQEGLVYRFFPLTNVMYGLTKDDLIYLKKRSVPGNVVALIEEKMLNRIFETKEEFIVALTNAVGSENEEYISKTISLSKKKDSRQSIDIQENGMYDKLINKFKWGGVNKSCVYLDDGIRRMFMSCRDMFSKLAFKLMEEGKADSAEYVLDKSVEFISDEILPFGYFSLELAEAYSKLGQLEKAQSIISEVSQRNKEMLDYYQSLGPEKKKMNQELIAKELGLSYEVMRVSYNEVEKIEFANYVATKIEKAYPSVMLYFTYAHDERALGIWYSRLSDFEKNIVSLYLQFKINSNK